MEFISIPPGEFVMGCSQGDGECDDAERPAHRARITKGFEIGKYEVTQAQWEAVMGSNPSEFKGADRPVENVSWEDAQQFLSRLNARGDGYRYRLPTEAEWEYAARAGTTGKYYGELDEIAWYDGNSGGRTHPVGQKKPNAWGVYDMSGNVWEWCSDWYDENYYGNSPGADPRGPASGQARSLRGGSWSFSLRSLRVSSRYRAQPFYQINDFGFRCVRGR
jgi:formylglycine-generating enzyme required for sulfatase activity